MAEARKASKPEPIATLDQTGRDGPAVNAGAPGAGVTEETNNPDGLALGHHDENGNATRR